MGDVDFEEAKKRASWITPVPGGNFLEFRNLEILNYCSQCMLIFKMLDSMFEALHLSI